MVAVGRLDLRAWCARGCLGAPTGGVCRCNTLKTLPCNKDYCSGFGVRLSCHNHYVVTFAHAVNTTLVTLAYCKTLSTSTAVILTR